MSYSLLDVSNHLGLHNYNTAQLYSLAGFPLCLLTKATGLHVAQQKIRQTQEKTSAYHGIPKFSRLFVSFFHLLYMLNPKVLLSYLQML